MILSIWRYSHFILALSTSAFVLIASVTGIILAFEPISNQLHPYAIEDSNSISIGETINHLEENYSEIYSLEIDENGFLKASVLDDNGESGNFYINPENGKNLGNRIKKKPIFEFATNLHRSLFLKSIGRFIIGLVSLLLSLIAITGVILIAKRQGGFKRWFSKVIKEDFNQYAHVVLGRYTLIPILIITLSGVYLSLERFSIIPKAHIVHITQNKDENKVKSNPQDFNIFKTSLLKDFVSLEFPFSPDEEDYYILKLKNREIYVQQYTGQIISASELPLWSKLLDWSLVLHTGKGTIIWSIILGLSCISILFFMYSGFSMSWKRIRGNSKFENTFQFDNAEFILLTGSETGSILKFAHAFAKALMDNSKSVFVDSLNNYTIYPAAKQLLIFTSTYGEGEAPSSAHLFSDKLLNIEQPNNLKYAVVGFGSLLYPDYCQYSIDVDNKLKQQNRFTQQLPLFKINNQSKEAFMSWVGQWNNVNHSDLKVKLSDGITKRKKLTAFKVINSTPLNGDETFTIQLKPQRKSQFKSGDLLAVYPKEDEAERLYSIGKIGNLITLSIKRHDKGLASNFLYSLIQGDEIKALLKPNSNFHFPKNAKEVILISNGTGIAPFLGMINDNINNVKTHLFWGGRNQDSLSIYSDYIDEAFSKGYLFSYYLALSQSDKKQYVQDLIDEQRDLFCSVLSNGGTIMICGSIAMQNEVIEKLEKLTSEQLCKPLSDFELNDQIKMDCY